jgi:hypothetical protein
MARLSPAIRRKPGDFDMGQEIDAAALTTFEVALDGSQVRLNVCDRAGEPASMILPAACINQLLMSLPRMVETALRNGHGDDSLRFVHPIESFSLELGAPNGGGEQQVILTIATGGGFKASFGAAEEVMMRLGHSIVHDIATHPLAQGPSVLRS